jgi:hypothetical protein
MGSGDGKTRTEKRKEEGNEAENPGKSSWTNIHGFNFFKIERRL